MVFEVCSAVEHYYRTIPETCVGTQQIRLNSMIIVMHVVLKDVWLKQFVKERN